MQWDGGRVASCVPRCTLPRCTRHTGSQATECAPRCPSRRQLTVVVTLGYWASRSCCPVGLPTRPFPAPRRPALLHLVPVVAHWEAGRPAAVWRTAKRASRRVGRPKASAPQRGAAQRTRPRLLRNAPHRSAPPPPTSSSCPCPRCARRPPRQCQSVHASRQVQIVAAPGQVQTSPDQSAALRRQPAPREARG